MFSTPCVTHDNVRLFIVTGGNVTYVCGNHQFIAWKVQNRRGDTSKRQAFGSELSLWGRAPAAGGVQAVGTVTCPVMPVMSATFLLVCPPFTALLVPALSPH